MRLRTSALYAIALAGLMVATDLMIAAQDVPQLLLPGRLAAARTRDLLYVGLPGVGNDVNYGGTGIVVLDASNSYKFVKRIATWDYSHARGPEPIKGISASIPAGLLYVSTNQRVAAFDIMTDQKVWENNYEGECCDRLNVAPAGDILYVPGKNTGGPNWTGNWWAVEAKTGKVIAKVPTPQTTGPHNTLFSPDGSRVFLSGGTTKYITVADPKTHKVVTAVGPFTNQVRTSTINSAGTLVYANMVDLLGFEIGDVRTGKVLHRVELTGPGYGFKDRLYGHGTPTHGMAISPDEKEVWIVDGVNHALHVFDNTVMPPKLQTSIKLRDHPGWITFSVDGTRVYPSTGDVIDAASKKIIAGLADEYGRPLQSEKLVDIRWEAGKPLRVGNSFGTGRLGPPSTSGH